MRYRARFDREAALKYGTMKRDVMLNEVKHLIEWRCDALSRALYATDASIYQIEPLGVVIPRDEQDVAAALRAARNHHAPILARGGGTSLAGQVVGRGIQLDFTKYMNRLLELNAEEGWAWAEPGMVLDHLNAQLAPHDLKFAPDISPSNRATIGGMIGNNSSGMYSIVYGKTIDHVLELRVMLSDGSIATLAPLSEDELREKLMLDSLEGRAYRTVRRLAREHADEIARRYPRVLRRVGGYNLDAFVGSPLSVVSCQESRGTTDNGLLTTDSFNLSKIIVGSEGTLAIVLAAKLRLVPRPKHTAIGILAFESLDAALEAVVPCLECQPAAVELMDEILLDLTRKSREYARYLASFVRGTPGGLLQVEFFGDTPEAVLADLDRLETHLRHRHEIDFEFTRATTPDHRAAERVHAPLSRNLPRARRRGGDVWPCQRRADSCPPAAQPEGLRRCGQAARHRRSNQGPGAGVRRRALGRARRWYAARRVQPRAVRRHALRGVSRDQAQLRPAWPAQPRQDRRRAAAGYASALRTRLPRRNPARHAFSLRRHRRLRRRGRAM